MSTCNTAGTAVLARSAGSSVPTRQLCQKRLAGARTSALVASRLTQNLGLPQARGRSGALGDPNPPASRYLDEVPIASRLADSKPVRPYHFWFATTLSKTRSTNSPLVKEQPASNLPSVIEDGEAYDLMVGSIPHGLEFYIALAREATSPWLEIACGTGRIVLPCLQAGVDVEELDLFEPMLKTLRAKTTELGLSPRLHQADMSDFSVPRRFGLVMIPFNALIHNMTQEAQNARDVTTLTGAQSPTNKGHTVLDR